MNCPRILLLFLATLAALPVHARMTDFPDTLTRDSVTLEKVGEGTLRWMFIKVYDGALYLDAENTGADPLDDVAKSLELHYSVGIEAEKFRESGNTILERNIDAATMRALKDPIAKINAAYQSVEKGDRYALIYIPGTGTTLELNGEPLVTVEGAEFAQAYFSIWLGDDPAQAGFRDDLLGE